MVVGNASDREYDILIMGGGIIGICCAWYAREKWPGKKIAVIEKSMVGKGTTAYSACLDTPYAVTPYKRLLTRKSRILFKELMLRHPHLPIKNIPFVGIAEDRSFEAILSNLAERDAITGKRPDFYSHVPGDFVLPEHTGFFHHINVGYTYGDFTYELSKELSVRDVTIYEGSEITEITSHDNAYMIGTNYGLNIRAAAVIDATGPWLKNRYTEKYQAIRQTRMKKVVALHINQVPPPGAPAIYFFDHDAFVLPQPHLSRWLFSYRCSEWDVEAGKSQYYITEKDMREARAVLKHYNSGFCDHIAGGRVSCDLYGPHGDPVIFSPSPNYVIAGAPGGSGFRLAPAMALEAIEKLERTPATTEIL